MKTILITGNKGFIGSYLEKILQVDYHIIGRSRTDGFDISNFDSLQKMDTHVDTIIHSAAIASNDYETSFQANVIGTLNLCKYAKENGIKHFILLSSIFAFDESNNGYFNSYGQTKKMSEEIAYRYCKENNIELTILRLAQVYDDARLAQSGQAMLYYFIDTIQSESNITLFGESNPLRNYIHIDYLCDVVKEVIKEQKVGTWNVIEKKNHTISEIAYMLFGLLKTEPKINYLPEKPNIPSVHIPNQNNYSSNKISSISLKEGLQRILNYVK